MTTQPKLFVTGATGQLGGLVIAALLEKVPAGAIVAGVRDTTSVGATALQAKGVETRLADYGRPETLRAAFAGIDRLLLISGSEVGQRRAQHRNVIAAAKTAGVGFLAYTSILHADRSPLFLAEEHRDTEAALAESGLPFALLRNGWYNEVFTWRLPPALQFGTLMGAAGEGRVSAAARADYARAAALVLSGGDHAGRVYELAGDTSFTLADLAAVADEAAGKPIAYRNMTADAFGAACVEAGVPDIFAKILSDSDAGTEKGALLDESRELSRLIGRPTTPFQATITDFVRALPTAGEAPGH